MQSKEYMSKLVTESMVARLLEDARHRVIAAMSSIGKATRATVLQLAEDLHTISGEAAMLDKTDLSHAAGDAEDAARLLAKGEQEALVPCMRALRTLGYLLQEASETIERKSEGGGHSVVAEPRRLLIVDDSPVAALALADVFEMHDFRVRVASTIEKAVEQFVAFSPSILVSDVHMPNLDVAELCRGFRAASAGRKVAVILVSGRTEAEVRARLDDIKPDAFVSKLSGAAAVVTRVNAVCQELFA